MLNLAAPPAGNRSQGRPRQGIPEDLCACPLVASRLVLSRLDYDTDQLFADVRHLPRSRPSARPRRAVYVRLAANLLADPATATDDINVPPALSRTASTSSTVRTPPSMSTETRRTCACPRWRSTTSSKEQGWAAPAEPRTAETARQSGACPKCGNRSNPSSRSRSCFAFPPHCPFPFLLLTIVRATQPHCHDAEPLRVTP